jgi:hypothetical protein
MNKLKRAYLITGDENYKHKGQEVLTLADVKDRARNSVELLAAMF